MLYRSSLTLHIVLLAACVTDVSVIERDRVETLTLHEDSGELWVESFEQPTGSETIDILWLIDRSCSMEAEEPLVLDGLNRIMTALPSTGWRLKLLTTDSQESRSDPNYPLFPGDTIANAEQALASIPLGLSAGEQGFSSATHYMTTNPIAPLWMRENATLLILFTSDEDDQSFIQYPSADDFSTWLYAAHPTAPIFVHSIVATSGQKEGRRYMDASDAFGSPVSDINSSDWTTGLELGLQKFITIKTWTLGHLPNASSIRVFWDGVPNEQWHYESVQNRVVFDVVPPPYTLVEIAYLEQSI